jgi:hypothetical protein
VLERIAKRVSTNHSSRAHDDNSLLAGGKFIHDPEALIEAT